MGSVAGVKLEMYFHTFILCVFATGLLDERIPYTILYIMVLSLHYMLLLCSIIGKYTLSESDYSILSILITVYKIESLYKIYIYIFFEII